MADVQYKDYIIQFKLFDGTTRNIPIRIPLGEPFRYEDFTQEQLEALRGPEGKAPNAVLYSVQNLTPEQKAQARENIGVVSTDEIINEVLAALPVAEGVKF